MVKVKVRAFAFIREKLGWREKDLIFNGKTIEDLLKNLKTMNGETLFDLMVEKGEIKPNFLVLLNGKEISYLKGLKTKLRDEDTVFIFPPAGGG